MADANNTARLGIIVDTSQATAALRSLQAQIATTNKSLTVGSGAAVAQQAALSKALMDSANASRMWNARVVPMTTATQQFTQALDKGKMSLGQYTRYAASQLPGMSRVFKREFDMMSRVAEQNVRRMQTQYAALGNSATGAAQAMAFTPTTLNKQAAATAMAAQRQMMMNRMIDLGTTKLLNWGKNTQWAGRQLMVGFSIPLAMMGAAAAKAFKEIDKSSIAFKRVYGDLSTTTAEMERNLQAVKDLGQEYTKYGIKLADTIELSSRVAATGAKNETLMAATEETLRLATLGMMDYGEALDATIALQTAFNVSNEDLASTIDFLNVVENETILTMQDMAAAIPRVAPVIKGLGGDVQDLAVFMTAMREGGITAEQGANALKSGLARMINPTKAAREQLAEFGISIDSIVQKNQGDLMGMVQEFGKALSTLGEFEQQQALEKVFGKYQYARLGALFKNIANDASQANRTIELAGMSIEDLASISERELSKIEEATSTKFQAAIEQLKISIAPLGETFMKALMPVINFITKIADKFNDLPDGIKNAIAIGVAAIAGIGPVVLMTVGLIANGIANLGKLVQTIRRVFARLRGDAKLFTYLTQEEQEARLAADGLSGAADRLTGKFLGQAEALSALITMLGRYSKALSSTAMASPMMMGGAPVAGATRAPGTVGSIIPPKLKFADGITGVPGTGNKDTIPALLTPGESVVTKEATQKYGPIISAMNAGTIPGFIKGIENVGQFGPSSTLSSASNSSIMGYTSRVFPQDPRQNRAQGIVVPSGEQLGAGMAAGFSRGFSKTAQQEIPVAETVYRRLIGITNQFSNNWQEEVDKIRTTTGKAEVSEEELEQARKRAAETTKRQIAQEEKASGRRLLSGPLRTHAFQQMGLPGYSAPITTLSRTGTGHADPIGRAGLMGVKTLREKGASPTTRERLRISYRGYGENLRSWAGEKVGISRPDWGHFGPKSSLPLSAASTMAAASGASATAPKVVAAVRSQITAGMSAVGKEGGSAFGINLVRAAESTTKDIVKKVLAGSGHRSPAPLMAETGRQDGKAYGLSWSKSIREAVAAGMGGQPLLSTPISQRPSGGSNISPNAQSITQIRASSAELANSMKLAVSMIKSGFIDAAKPFTGPMIQAAKLAAAKVKSAYETAAIKTMMAMDSVKKLPQNLSNQINNASNQMKSSFNQIKARLMNMAQTSLPGMGQRLANKAFYGAQDLMGKARLAGGIAMNPVPRALAMDIVRQKSMEKLNSVVGSATNNIKTFASSALKAGKIIMNPVPRSIAMAVMMDKTIKPALASMGNVVDTVKTKLSAFGGAVSRGAQIIANPIPRAIALTTVKNEIMKASKFVSDTIKLNFKTAMEIGKISIKQGFDNAKLFITNSAQSIKASVLNMGQVIKTSAGQLKAGFTLAAEEIRKAGRSAAIIVAESGKVLGNSIKAAAAGIRGYMAGTDAQGRTRGSKFASAGNASMMGLMGLSMAASFAGGEVGEMAQKIMPVTMGLMVLQMILPMLTNPLGLAIIAITALVGGFIYLRKQLDDAAKEAAQLGANMGGVANGMKIIEEATGFAVKSPEDRLFRFTDEDRKAMTEFGSYFESEAGSKFIEELKSSTSEERYKKVTALLAQGIASGLEEDKAKAFGFAIAEATGDALLKSSIARDFANQIFGSGSQALIDLERERMSGAPSVGNRVDYSNLNPYQLGRTPENVAGATAQGAVTGTAVGATVGAGAVLGAVALGLLAASPGPQGVITLPAAAFVALAAGIGAAGGAVKSYIDAQERQKETTKEAARGLGFSIQTIENLKNAEAVLEEQRRSGTITIDEYFKQQEDLNNLEKQNTEYIGSLFSMGADMGAMMQALGNQLSFAGFDESQIRRITSEFGPDALAQRFFEQDFGDLEQAQQKYVQEVFSNVMSGLTPENISQRLEDVQGIYSDISQQVVQAIIDGTFNGLDGYFNKESLARAIESRMGGGLAIGTRKGISPEQMAQNLLNVQDELIKRGTDVMEVFTRLAEFSNQMTAKEILADPDKILEFANVVSKLAEYESISIEFVVEKGLDPDKILYAVEAIDRIQLDPKIFKNASLDSDLLAQNLLNAGVNAEDIPKNVAKGVKEIEKFGKDAVNKLGNIKPEIVPQIVANVFGTDATTAGQVSDALNNAFPNQLSPIDLAIILSLAGNPNAISLLTNPQAIAAAKSGKTTAAYTERRGQDSIQRQLDVSSIAAVSMTGGGNVPTGDGNKPPKDTGGGSETKSFLEETRDNIAANLELFVGDTANKVKSIMSQIDTKFKGINIPVRILESLGAGPEGLKKAKELLGLSKKEMKTFVQNFIKSTGAEAIQGLTFDIGRTARKTVATNKLSGQSEEVRNIILEDEALTDVIATYKAGDPLYDKAIRRAIRLANEKKKLAEATQTEEEAQKEASEAVLASIQNQIDTIEVDLTRAFENTYGMLPAEMELEIEKRQRIIREIEKQIEAINKLNSVDEDRIEKLNREKEMISRQIELLERANEMDQRRADDLKRQDEIRNRESEALSHELELMSQVEEKIRQSYQQRIDALDKVARVNDYIINQQKQQLGLSQAISQGDIYAATAAAQEMRASSAQFATEQARTGLEQGMNNAIGGLLTSGGLTRDQAEERIRQIKEQSYQTSLLIRDIEDKIYARNQQMVPLKDQQYQLDLQIRDIQDIIYERNQEIKNIQNDQVLPLTTQNELQQGILDKLKEEVDDKTGPLKARYDWYKQQESLNESVRQQTKNIEEWTKRGRDRASELAANWGSVAANAWEASRAIAAATGAKAAQGNYAGGIIKYGMGGKVRYAVGGISGDGSRDSVAAMLTPGEFVIRKAMVNKYGKPMLEAINQGSFSLPKYNMPEMETAEVVQTSNVSNINAPVYNTYDMKFAINGTNANADDIANRVMFKMRQIQDQGIRSNRGY